MAFETSSATDGNDLLQKLVTFLVANAWTQDRSAVEGLGWTATLHKGSDYVHFRSARNELEPVKNGPSSVGYSISLYMGTGFSSGAMWNSQLAGSPLQSNDAAAPRAAAMALRNAAIPNYYFFTDVANNNVVVVVEKSSGVYAAMGWGLSLANKCGAWTGGQYFWGTTSGYFAHDVFSQTNIPGQDATANCPGQCGDNYGGCASYVRADVDAFTGLWVSVGPDPMVINPFLGYTGKLGSSMVAGWNLSSTPLVREQIPGYSQSGLLNAPGAFQGNQVSLAGGGANLLPILWWVLRDGSGAGYSPIGDLPLVYATSAVGQGYAPAEDYLIGSDTYTLFPFFAVQKFV